MRMTLTCGHTTRPIPRLFTRKMTGLWCGECQVVRRVIPRGKEGHGIKRGSGPSTVSFRREEESDDSL